LAIKVREKFWSAAISGRGKRNPMAQHFAHKRIIGWSIVQRKSMHFKASLCHFCGCTQHQ